MINNKKNITDKNFHFKSLIEISLSKGGRIKEGEVYISNKTKMTFIDKLGNEFQTTPSSIKRGNWSPYESGRVRDPEYHMKELEEIALSRGGRLKEGEIYSNAKTKMTFIDKVGNEFKMIPDAVKRGHWSPFEAGNVFAPEYHMRKLEEIVLSKGGKIKEGEKYINTSTKMTFIDKVGNEFKMIPSAVKSGQWSPFESGKVFAPEYHMKELEKIALSRGGRVKEGEKYINAKTKMIFIDQLGNEFKTTPSHIKGGRWSPYEKNYSEHICRQIIEQLYNKEFSSSWSTIKRDGKKNLQLDGYNEKLKIAFEYQGEQHTFGWFNKDENQKQIDLIESKKRDKEKKQICVDNGILLLEINYYKSIKNIQDLIIQTINDVKKSYEINKKNIPEFINKLQIDQIKIDLSKISHLALQQKEIEEIVLSKGGKIKEGEYYISNTTKMTFIDKSGNEFKMIPRAVKSGSWSPYESGKVLDPEYHMKELKNIVLSKGGKIKEGESYLKAKTKMTFIDKSGNEFKMTPNDIKNGNWSPYESGNIRDPEYHMRKLEEIVSSKGGKIKEGEKYINNKTKIIFIDKLGNEFKMIPSDIKRGHWSPFEYQKNLNDISINETTNSSGHNKRKMR